MVRILIVLLVALVCPPNFSAGASEIGVVTVTGPINPVTVDYVTRSLKQAQSRRDLMFLMEIDTPGGLDGAMRSIVKEIFRSSIPVVVYVAPAGARAASAGAVIALAADVCAMAPGTNIGAAHPVRMGGKTDRVMEDKMLNDAEAYLEAIARQRGRDQEIARRMVRESRSLSAEAAVQAKVVDLVAASRPELLTRLEGRIIQRGGRSIALHTAGARVVDYKMGPRDELLNAIGNPDVAYVLMLLGILGLFFELSTPGAILPGVIGAISLILAFFAFQTLPVNYAGALLVLLAVLLFVAEIKIVSHGVLAIGGTVAMVLGSVLMFPSPEPYLRLSPSVIAVTVTATALFFLVVVAKAIQARRAKPVTGVEGLLGSRGIADTEIAPTGKVLLHGAYWNATGTEPIGKGEEIEVTAVEGLRLTVRRPRSSG